MIIDARNWVSMIRLLMTFYVQHGGDILAFNLDKFFGMIFVQVLVMVMSHHAIRNNAGMMFLLLFLGISI